MKNFNTVITYLFWSVFYSFRQLQFSMVQHDKTSPTELYDLVR